MHRAGTSRRPHFCLTGGWFSSHNIGDQAILLGLIDSAPGLGDPHFSVLTANPRKVAEQYGLRVFAPKKNPLRLVRNLLGADALIFTGGTPFYDAKPHMSYYASLARIAHARGIPVVAFGVSLRSVRSRYCRTMLGSIVRCADLLGAREADTLAAFERLAPGQGKARLVPDTATQMVPSDPSRAANLLAEAHLDAQAKNVAICVRDFSAQARFRTHHYSRRFDSSTLAQYHRSIQCLAEHVVSRHDANVVFFPMHTVAPDDDRRVASEIRTAVHDRGLRRRITVIQRQHGPRDMKAMLGCMYAVVGVRFHSVVLATSMFVPSLAVSYARKNRAYMDYLGLPQHQVDLVHVAAGTLIERFNELIDQRSSVVDTLRTRYAQIHCDFQTEIAHLRALIVNHRRRVA